MVSSALDSPRVSTTSPVGLGHRSWYLFTVMTEYLQYRAGPAIFHLLREEGLDPRRVRVFAGPGRRAEVVCFRGV